MLMLCNHMLKDFVLFYHKYIKKHIEIWKKDLDMDIMRSLDIYFIKCYITACNKFVTF